MRVTGLSWMLVVAALAACSAEDGSNGSVGLYSLFDPVANNPSLCGGPAIPYPNNALFALTGTGTGAAPDATLDIPNGSENTVSAAAPVPFVKAANLTDGFSTTASAFTDVLGAVNFATAPAAVQVLEVNGNTPANWRFLTYGVDYTLQPSIAMAQVSGTGHSTGTCVASAITPPAQFKPISEQRSRILIEPLKPLKPSTTYIIAVTKALKSKDGVPATPGEQFEIVNSDTPVANQTAPVLALMTPTQLGTLEALRSTLVRPTVLKLKQGDSVLRSGALKDSDLVIAWSFTTQSIGLTLSRLNTSSNVLYVANTTISTGDLGLGLADTADIWAGTLDLPYYLANSGGNPNSGAPLATAWASANVLNPADPRPPAYGGAYLCSQLAKSVSTTLCYPDPAVASTEKVPVIVTVPNANSGQTKPANGWPVVIFQHGITRNRTDVLAIAPTLAAAGFVTISMDIPLHGVTNNSTNIATNPFYGNQIFTNPAFGGTFNYLLTGERTFNLDLMNNSTGAAPSPDGVIDPSGTWFINLSNLLVSRDNLRQAEADDLHLARSLGYLDLDQNNAALATTDIDETRVRFVGQSLGAIVGTTVLGVDDGTDATLVDDEVIQAGSLNVPGGGLGKLLDASAAFGPRISAGLAASFVFEGTDTYETFIRFAQHLVDPADPINYAAAANANHNLHVIEAIDDAVVPNSAMTTCPSPLPAGLGASATALTAIATATASGVAGAALVAACPPLVLAANPPLTAITYQDETIISGFLSGTDPLVRVMGLSHTFAMGSAPFAQQTTTPGQVADSLVVFEPDTAEHGTLLTPNASSNPTQPNATFAAATCAEQKQTATFLASNGALLPIGGSCP